jgi:hypothetical protein
MKGHERVVCGSKRSKSVHAGRHDRESYANARDLDNFGNRSHSSNPTTSQEDKNKDRRRKKKVNALL